MSRIVSVDFETFFSSRLRYTLKLQIAEQYCRHELFDPYLISVSDGTQTWAGPPANFNFDSLAGATLISNNAYFDRTVYNEMVRRVWAPQVQYKEWLCVANMTSFLCNRRSLDQAAEHLLKVKLSKAPRDKMNGMRWADCNPTEKEEMIAYAKGDALYCWQLYNQFGSKWPAHERRISELTIAAGMRGLQIDAPLLNTYILQTHDMKTATEALIPWLDTTWDEADEFDTKPTSTKCIAEQCRRVGIPCAPVISDDPEKYEEWENLYFPNHPWILALSSWRSVNKMLKTLMVVKERLRDDGTMPFGSKYCGSITGRVSGESRVNLYNMRKQAVLCRQDGLMATDDIAINEAHIHKKKTGAWPEWVKHGINFRNLIIPRPGHRLVTSDLSQIEPRVLAWLAGDTEFLTMIASGTSPYEAHARLTMDWTGGVLKHENEKLYGLAKIRVLQLGYGSGWEKFIATAKKEAGIDLTVGDPEWIETTDPVTGEPKKVSGYGQNSRQVVKDYRDSNPKITALWSQLEMALRYSVGSDLVLRLPSGRELRYESVRAETRIEPDKETKKPRRKTVFTVCLGGKRGITYGAKLCANLTSATAREVFMEHVLSLDDAGCGKMLIGVYDEAVLEIPLDSSKTVEDVKAIMSQTPAWLPGCPVAADAREVTCYQK